MASKSRVQCGILTWFSTDTTPLYPEVERNADLLVINRPQHHRDAQITQPKSAHTHVAPLNVLTPFQERWTGTAKSVPFQAQRTNPPFHHSSSAAAAAFSLLQHPSLPLLLPDAGAGRPGIISSSSSSMPSERTPGSAPKCSASVRTFGSLAL